MRQLHALTGFDTPDPGERLMQACYEYAQDYSRAQFRWNPIQEFWERRNHPETPWVTWTASRIENWWTNHEPSRTVPTFHARLIPFDPNDGRPEER